LQPRVPALPVWQRCQHTRPPTVLPPVPKPPPLDVRCPQCGYNLRGIPERQCPECGFARAAIESWGHIWLEEAREPYRAARRRAVAGLFLALPAAPVTLEKHIAHLLGVALVGSFLAAAFRGKSNFQPASGLKVALPAALLFSFAADTNFTLASAAARLSTTLTAPAWVAIAAARPDPPYLAEVLEPPHRGDLNRVRAIAGLLIGVATIACLLACDFGFRQGRPDGRVIPTPRSVPAAVPRDAVRGRERPACRRRRPSAGRRPCHSEGGGRPAAWHCAG